MKILIVTEMYPEAPGQSASEVPYMIHRYARELAKWTEVAVINPFPYPVWRAKSIPQVREGHQFLLDGILVTNDSVVFLPFSLRPFPFRAFFSLKKFFRFAEAFAPDIVLGAMPIGSNISLGLSKSLSVPLVVQCHSTDIRFSSKGRSLGKFNGKFKGMLDFASLISCPSPWIQRTITSWNPDLGPKTVLTPPPIEPEIFIPAEEGIARLNHWRSGGTVQIITPCRLVEHKKVDLVLRALAKVGNQIDWNYTIVGDGPERARLQNLAADLGLTERVSFFGQRPRAWVLDRLAQSHLMVMVSTRETFGQVYLEAMAKGSLVVGTRGVGADGTIKDGVNGFLCAPEDDGALKEKLRHIFFGLPCQSLEKVVVSGRDTASRHTIDKLSRRFHEQLVDLLSRRNGAATKEA